MITANMSSSYLWRIGLIVLFCFGMSLWFLYDGAVKYPAQRERALMYQTLDEQNRLGEWKEITSERGWPLEYPGDPMPPYKITAQFIMAAMAFPPGFLYLIFFLRCRGRWIEASETGLRTSWGQQLEFGDILALDKKKWKAKGIAKLKYQQGNRKRRLVLDDYKYDREPTGAILRQVESHLDDEQIVGGLREPPLEASSQDAEPAAESETNR